MSLTQATVRPITVLIGVQRRDAAPSADVAPSADTAPAAPDVADQLRKLGELHAAGI
jgi:hypothetical protein